METVGHSLQKLTIADSIPTCRRGDSILSIGHQCNLRWAHLLNKLAEALDRVTLNIELGLNICLKLTNIGVANMSCIGARVDSDAIGTKLLDIECCLQQIRHISTTRIAHYGNLIDINA